MSINRGQFECMVDYFYDMRGCGVPSFEWMNHHANIYLDDVSHTVTIEIDNMDEQDYAGWRKAGDL